MSEQAKYLGQNKIVLSKGDIIDKELFHLVSDIIERYIPNPNQAHFLDVGGGNGSYADKLIGRYPGCQVTIVDPDENALNENNPNSRKNLIQAHYQSFDCFFKYDLIQFNWVLNHFVAPTYSKTHDLQLKGLKDAYDMLAPEGIVVIFENLYEGTDHSNIPGKRIYQLTSSTLIKTLVAKLGSNTAGVGVCFNSELFWREQLIKAGFSSVFSAHCYDFGNLNPIKKWLLGIENQRVGMIVGVKSD